MTNYRLPNLDRQVASAGHFLDEFEKTFNQPITGGTGEFIDAEGEVTVHVLIVGSQWEYHFHFLHHDIADDDHHDDHHDDKHDDNHHDNKHGGKHHDNKHGDKHHDGDKYDDGHHEDGDKNENKYDDSKSKY